MKLQKAKSSRRILLLGATGTVGQATHHALLQQGYQVVCFLRESTKNNTAIASAFEKSELRFGDVTQQASMRDEGFRGESFDAVISCLASRTGAPDDARLIDYQANLNALTCAKNLGVRHLILLSAICVQKPRLAFQFAKLDFEKELIASGLTFSIVRPTALFKSLSGQIERLRQGKSFLLFGDGTLTACKPISDADLAQYLVRCIEDSRLHNQILPIGGPGPAITPRQQGEKLFELLQQPPRYRHVPVALLDVIIKTLSLMGKVIPNLSQKAELARIGKFYATESMLVFNQQTGRYDEVATPSTGTETLFDYYADIIATKTVLKKHDHSVF